MQDWNVNRVTASYKGRLIVVDREGAVITIAIERDKPAQDFFRHYDCTELPKAVGDVYREVFPENEAKMFTDKISIIWETLLPIFKH